LRVASALLVPGEADMGLLDAARGEVLAMTRAARERIQNDVASVTDPAGSVDPQMLARYSRGVLRREAQNQAMLRTFETGRPVTYAVAVSAPATALEALRGSANVRNVAVGYAVSADRAILPVPDLPEGRSTGLGDDPTSGLSDVEVLTKVKARGTQK
jgi:hypothetical protein